ncbi:predicted protein [Chaetoceros tenuissimus]|uniref:Uncharacterized protein n=1 Tax=Chaetoceros tenuissimus TaxID=426638 RepID=A0AAD3H4E8_9STRA|nr:predicted protein [Chaetoceros tenuissimus]
MKAYIKGWFSRKANDLKQEALASNGDFTQLTKSKLKELIRKKFQLVKVTEKAVLIRLLQISSRMQTDEGLDCSGKTLGEMKEECENLGIPTEENTELMNVVRDTRREELVCERGDN